MLKKTNKKTKNLNIMLLAGGTGGHIFPAEAFAEFCLTSKQNDNINLFWVGTNRGLEQKIASKHNIKFKSINFDGLKAKNRLHKIYKTICLPLSITKGVWGLRQTFKDFKPDIILSFGGYSTVPGGILAKLTKTPLILHEQNAIVGRANKILSKISTKHLSGYPNIFPYKYNKSSYHTGTPLRQDLINNNITPLQHKKSQNNKSEFNILIIGGSLGARFINTLMPKILNQIIIKNNITLNITHQCGSNNYKTTVNNYDNHINNNDNSLNIKKNIKIVRFIDNINLEYLKADLIISRSGALSVAEITHFAIPAIFIPYPQAMDNHQFYNAQGLINAKAAFCLTQKQINQDINLLTDLITKLINNKSYLNSIKDNALKFAMTNKNALACENIYNILRYK